MTYNHILCDELFISINLFDIYRPLGGAYLAMQFISRIFRTTNVTRTYRRCYSNNFGFIFDIDGVLIRGKKKLPTAAEAFKKLVNGKGEFIYPTVFVTNAGNAVRNTKATQLSRLFDVEIDDSQVIMSHSPLRLFTEFHSNHVLISGQVRFFNHLPKKGHLFGVYRLTW